MKLSCLLVAVSIVAATVRWANDAEISVMIANDGKIGIAPTMANDVEKQTMKVERMFNIIPGLVPSTR